MQFIILIWATHELRIYVSIWNFNKIKMHWNDNASQIYIHRQKTNQCPQMTVGTSKPAHMAGTKECTLIAVRPPQDVTLSALINSYLLLSALQQHIHTALVTTSKA